MDNQSLHVDVDEAEEVSDSFICCICLDLLYKPIVLSCGHVSCFWCVHKSMSYRGESHCPICRHAYNHFPSICQTLHVLLSKLYPIAYKMREKQVLEEEKKTGVFSPQFGIHACVPLDDKELNHSGDASNYSITVCESTSKGGSHEHMEQLKSVLPSLDDGTTIPKQTSGGTVANCPENKLNGNFKQILITDALCNACKQLVLHPVVLNCGHVYCKTCIIKPTDEQLRCQVCECLNPRGFPKVCLELDRFLQEQFRKEYALRRDAVQLKKIQLKQESATMCSMEAGKLGSLVPTGENLPWWADPRPKVHFGCACDYCGVYPIIGERYRCKDCVEAVGFNLCGDCCNTSSKRPGRFNQQHAPEHRLELVKSNIVSNVLLRLLTEPLQDVSPVFAAADDVLQNGSSVMSPTHDQESSSNG